jgi:hypothetical protein
VVGQWCLIFAEHNREKHRTNVAKTLLHKNVFLAEKKSYFWRIFFYTYRRISQQSGTAANPLAS